ncbi:MAG TPA: hypothetical protein VMH88_14275 [Gemmatimonadales bacterium]|nr:hypothetical protein [Gemmatimonadales bacterium]HTR22014.1 hypothetical protein [Gemmatimonadales bacterium]
MTQEPARDAELDQALTLRLLQASPIAELALVALAAVSVGFLFHVVPLTSLVVWGLAVTAAALGRTWWRRRVLRTNPSAQQIRHGLRLWVAASALIWGCGAGLLAVHVPFQLVALSIVVLAGLVAGGLVTLMPDRPAFKILLGSLFVPLVLGILAGGIDRERVAAMTLIAVFAGFELVVHQRAYRDLVEHESTKALAVRQHRELEESLTRVKLLSGLLPICAGCKKIRDAADVWHEVEVYVREHSEAEFTHGLCPSCARQFERGLPLKEWQTRE